MTEVRGLRKGCNWVPPPCRVLARQGTTCRQRMRARGPGGGAEPGHLPSSSRWQRERKRWEFSGAPWGAHSLWLFLQTFLPAPRQHSSSLAAKESSGGRGRRSMDAHMGVYRASPGEGGSGELRIRRVWKLPVWELATLTKKEPSL